MKKIVVLIYCLTLVLPVCFIGALPAAAQEEDDTIPSRDVFFSPEERRELEGGSNEDGGTVGAEGGGGTVGAEGGDSGFIKLKNPFAFEGGLIELIEVFVTDIIIPLGAVIAALAIIYSGFLFVTARGDTEQLKKARQSFLYAVIGAAILLGSWAIAVGIKATIDRIRGSVSLEGEAAEMQMAQAGGSQVVGSDPFGCTARLRTEMETFGDFACGVFDVLTLLIPILSAAALLLFFWGLVVFIANADNETKRAESRHKMLWGIVALFVLVSFMGIIRILAGDFGFEVGVFPFFKN